MDIPTVSRCSTWARRSPRGADGCAGEPARHQAYLGETKTIGAGGSRAEATTLARLLQRNARDLRDRPAIREKARGIWQTWTWGQYHDQVPSSPGLAALGFKPRRAAVGHFGDNRPRLYWAQVPRSAWRVPVPVYQTRSPRSSPSSGIMPSAR